jgi:hypothetical protein
MLDFEDVVVSARDTEEDEPPAAVQPPIQRKPDKITKAIIGERSRGSRPHQKRPFKPRPRGQEGGPLRTPLHIGDAWQSEDSYEVDKVRSRCMVFFFRMVNY